MNSEYLIPERPKEEAVPFVFGFVASLVCHVFFAVLTIIVLENSAANASKESEVFTVTLEAGPVLGGKSQIPKEGAKKILTPDQNSEEEESTEKAEKNTDTTKEKETTKQEKVEPKEEDIKLKAPSAVDDPEKILAERKKEEERKLKEEKKIEEAKIKKEEEKKKKKEDEKKAKDEQVKQEKAKQVAEEKKKAEDEKKKAEEAKKKQRVQRDKQLEATLKKLKQQYEGESSDVGGSGFGAAKIGAGSGGGGGTLASLEKVRYSNALKDHVKQGWRWLNATDKLIAKVQVSILPDGRVQNVNIIQSSGNQNFDDSVVRAVFKASPVPPAPSDLYDEFKNVVFTFDPAE